MLSGEGKTSLLRNQKEGGKPYLGEERREIARRGSSLISFQDTGASCNPPVKRKNQESAGRDGELSINGSNSNYSESDEWDSLKTGRDGDIFRKKERGWWLNIEAYRRRSCWEQDGFSA